MRVAAHALLIGLSCALPAVWGENTTLVGAGTLPIPGGGEVRMLMLSQASGSISFVAIEGCSFETLDIQSTPARPVIAWSTSPNSVCDSGTLPRGSIDRELQSIAARLKPGRIWGISQD